MYLRGKRYETEKKIVSNEKGNNQYTKEVGDHNDHQPDYVDPRPKTREKIATEYGVGQTTIQRDAQYARAVDAMPPDTKEKILSGEEKVSKNDMMEFAMNSLTFISKIITMDFRENLVIITSKEELHKVIDEAVSKAIAGLNLTRQGPEETPKLIYGLDKLAEFLGCSMTTAFRMKKSGRIPYYQHGHVIMFKSDEVLQAISKGKKN